MNRILSLISIFILLINIMSDNIGKLIMDYTTLRTTANQYPAGKKRGEAYDAADTKKNQLADAFMKKYATHIQNGEKDKAKTLLESIPKDVVSYAIGLKNFKPEGYVFTPRGATVQAQTDAEKSGLPFSGGRRRSNVIKKTRRRTHTQRTRSRRRFSRRNLKILAQG